LQGQKKVLIFWGARIPMKFGNAAPNAARIIDAALRFAFGTT
jgi:hypothetical protein